MKRNVCSILLPLFCWLLIIPPSYAAPKIAYTLSMQEPQTHYFDVEMRISDPKEVSAKTDFIDIKMPVWTPGSYLVREYAKNVEGFTARDAKGQALKATKINKNTWRVFFGKSDQVAVTYKVYAYELSVRTSFLDMSHGYLNGASVFMYLDKHLDLPAILTVNPYKGWTEIATALPSTKGNKFQFEVPNFDILVDSPIEIGTHKTLTFTALNVPHRMAMYGEAIYDAPTLLADMKKVTEEAASVVGENPCKDYLFIVHHTPAGGGGLEHLNSTTLQTSRTSYLFEGSYNGFLGLVAHEYFHLWNVKRIRPKALGPFDYENENYTTMLWFSEGFTSYYGNYIMRRAKLTGTEQYLNSLVSEINSLENTPGNKVQSASESSMDAWIKFYRPNENSANSTISYYSKGSVLGNLMNLEIMHSTNSQKSLDDVMRYLYSEYYKKQNRGFTDEEFQKAVEMVAGKSMDDFFQKYIQGTEPIPYNQFFGYAGLQLVDNNQGRNEIYLGVGTSFSGGKLIVTSVARGSSAYQAGLNVNDELVSFDNVRLADDLNRQVSMKKVGDKVKFLVNRSGILQEIEVTLGKNTNVSYRIERKTPTPEQATLYKKWLRAE